MSLPFLYFVPNSDDDWKAWAFNHAADHYSIVNQVFISKSQNLTPFILSPMDKDDVGMWLYQHAIMHSQMNQAVGTSGNDLLSLDWSDPDQFAQWLRLNATEHQAVSAALGLG